jgi:hypothetical protein
MRRCCAALPDHWPMHAMSGGQSNAGVSLISTDPADGSLRAASTNFRFSATVIDRIMLMNSETPVRVGVGRRRRSLTGQNRQLAI